MKERNTDNLEGKKKLQEKAAAKAAIRAQKEVEKKQKDREKKLKKKGAVSEITANEKEPADKEVEEAEPDISDNVEQVNEPSALRKAKDRKETALKYPRTAKIRGGLPKAVPR